MTDLQKTIRKAQPADTERILAIYETARAYMRSTGNPGQWTNGYPGRDQLARDMQKGASYVCLAGDCIAGTFYFAVENEPSYASIRGAWLNDEPYGLIHRRAEVRNCRFLPAMVLCRRSKHTDRHASGQHSHAALAGKARL